LEYHFQFHFIIRFFNLFYEDVNVYFSNSKDLKFPKIIMRIILIMFCHMLLHFNIFLLKFHFFNFEIQLYFYFIKYETTQVSLSAWILIVLDILSQIDYCFFNFYKFDCKIWIPQIFFYEVFQELKIIVFIDYHILNLIFSKVILYKYFFKTNLYR
jgi:hypothetical protein